MRPLGSLGPFELCQKRFLRSRKRRRYTDQSAQEECDVLVLVLSKNTEPIALSDFRAVMLATLRSLAPKDWDTEHEVAWNWLWENVERILKGQLGKPKSLERALTHFIASWSEEQAMFFRKACGKLPMARGVVRELYKRFFALAPSGQDFFKQSSTYFLADRVVEMTVEMFREPRKMVQEISGLGLRHVGWGIPPELFGPYTSGAVESVRSMTTDDNTQSAFRFSLSLIAKILVRAVSEGSTLVMRAINTNQESAMKKAIAIAPRGKRAMELLNISVGTQSISPLFWSIESGSLNSARAMIVDLLTIRADRDVYYYGCDAMFTRHPDLILRLCNDASTLLWTLFDGLVWRSRLVQDGQRRVNYYIKHLVQDLEGNFSPALKWLAHHKDPRLVSHGVVMTFADLLWNRVASYQFLLGRGYFLFTLLVFITSQSFLVPGEERLWRNILTFVCRCFLYLVWLYTTVFLGKSFCHPFSFRCTPPPWLPHRWMHSFHEEFGQLVCLDGPEMSSKHFEAQQDPFAWSSVPPCDQFVSQLLEVESPSPEWRRFPRPLGQDHWPQEFPHTLTSSPVANRRGGRQVDEAANPGGYQSAMPCSHRSRR
ncbi:unnamed protein product [Cladocopium goreaui]|uniref:NEDD8-like protein RUB1 n=1 Tax=Cladocopium goreaui TaxID=2562237 RepID=A0A9P1FY85_9DINO|nr:unnamed protein product [Cladocopium goreaui]